MNSPEPSNYQDTLGQLVREALSAAVAGAHPSRGARGRLILRARAAQRSNLRVRPQQESLPWPNYPQSSSGDQYSWSAVVTLSAIRLLQANWSPFRLPVG